MGGNPLKGEVAFVGSDGERRTLSFSAEALFRLEEQLGRKMGAIEADMRNPENFGLGVIRTMFWAGLLDTHPDLELKDVGRHFSKVDPVEACSLVVRAFNGAFGTLTEAAPANPPEPGQTP
ncbi:hypothetical protein [Bradyrhizobium sp. BRP23]|uniref:hypothetical protein n=1 Tax=Bradyrhizobium sp. BRP23 TaxID=2793820 RepID=UPI001CD63F50|nr:hypothetical protein [Bradyrhizobium sp. BRP23]MCA1381301.1 hypothetical protein [Bradyrhizobium sp. BRP05]MCA1418579.1 hypothetical protein [Bradyrhizobium sp. BRP23]